MRMESTGWNNAALATPTTVPDRYMCSTPCPTAHNPNPAVGRKKGKEERWGNPNP